MYVLVGLCWCGCVEVCVRVGHGRVCASGSGSTDAAASGRGGRSNKILNVCSSQGASPKLEHLYDVACSPWVYVACLRHVLGAPANRKRVCRCATACTPGDSAASTGSRGPAAREAGCCCSGREASPPGGAALFTAADEDDSPSRIRACGAASCVVEGLVSSACWVLFEYRRRVSTVYSLPLSISTCLNSR